MKTNVNEALEQVEMTYSELVEIANDMTSELFQPINQLIDAIGDDINALPLDDIKNYMWQLQHKAYTLSEVKEKSALKASLAEILKNETYAQNFNAAEGTAVVRQNLALIANSEQIVAEALYELIANSIKTKVDQIHRCVDCLKSILVTRMQEAKLTLSNMD